MTKRKLDAVSVGDQGAQTAPVKKLAGILKTESSSGDSKSIVKTVTFPPPDELGQTLRLVAKGQLEEGDLSVVIGLLESLRGPSLVMWLEELQANITVLGTHKSEQMEGLVMELLKLRWADQDKAVVTAYKSFL